jgi:hypothetical protein
MDEISITPSTAAGQPAIAGFRGTQFVAVWEDGSHGSIKGQMLSTAGKKTSDEFRVNFPGQPATKRRLPAIVETEAGFVVAWSEQAPGAAPGTGAQLKLRTFDADTLSGPETQVSSAEVEPLIRPALARLNDGGFIVVWADKRADERIRAQRFGFDGEKAGPEFRANSVPGLHRVPMVAGLTNGKIVVGWRGRLLPALSLHLQLFDAEGPGGEQATGIEITEAAMAPLDSGRFVVAHVRSAGDSEPGFETTVAQASVFEASGAFSGRRFPATAGRILSSWPSCVPLAGDRFILAWTETNVDAPGAGTDVMARLFSQAGGAIGNAVKVNTSTGHARFSLSAAATAGPDGETLFAIWADDTQQTGVAPVRTVHGRPLPIPAGGF